MKPLVIHKSNNPRAFKHIDKTHLPVHYRANQKAWMTGEIFEEWFKNCFAKEAEDHMKKTNLSFKILLVVENCASHPQNMSTDNIRVVFLPPNTTSVLQPLKRSQMRMP